MTSDKLMTFKRNAVDMIIYSQIMNDHILSNLKLLAEKEQRPGVRISLNWNIELMESVKKVLNEAYECKFDESFDISELMKKHRANHNLIK